MKVGDKVKFLNDVGGGLITKLIDKKTALVLNEDEFEVPVLLYDLLKVEDENDFFNAGNNSINNSKQVEIVKQIDFFGEEDSDVSDKESNEIDLYFAFVPTNQANLVMGEIDVYIINDSNWNLIYNYQLQIDNKYISFPGKLSSNMKEHLITLNKKQIQDYRNIIFQGIVYQKNTYEFRVPIFEKININPERFYKLKTFSTNDYFEEKAFILPIYEENLMAEAVERLTKSKVSKVIKNKEFVSKNINKPKKFKRQEKNLLVEIDLHLHELVDNEKGLSPKDKLDIQMKHFKEEIEKAINDKKVTKIVFIHGKGEGVLKNEILTKLKRNYKHLNSQDASFQKYGYGATLVFV